MATNVIDALVMTLGLDITEFDKNRKRSVEDTTKFKKKMDGVAKDVAHGGKVMAEGFRFIKTELLGLLAVAGAATGLKAFIADNVQGQAELGRLSQNLGISARSLEAWGLVAKEMGGQASDAFGALQAVAGGLAEASIRGHSALTDMARANGVILTDAKGQVLGYEDALVSISKRLSELPRQQARYLADQLGVGSMFNELMLGPQELRRRLEYARRITGVTDESTAAAMRLQKQWADIQQRFKEASEIAFAKLSPVLERLALRFADWLDSVDWGKVGRGIEDVAHYAKSFADEIADARDDINSINWGPLASVLKTAVEHAKEFLGYLQKIHDFGLGVRHRVGQWAADHANDPSVAAQGSVASKFMTWLAGKNGIPVASRGIRNNNPGNINFAGQPGAHLESGPNARFAAFGSLQEGIAALVRQLALYASRGIDTITGIVNKYAPAADGNNVAAYVAALVKATGKGANEHLDLSNLDTLIPLVQAITRQEGNGTLTADQVLGGIRLGARRQALRSSGLASRTSTSETHIGKIEVHTAATDAKGIVRDIRHELGNNTLIAQADTGVQ